MFLRYSRWAPLRPASRSSRRISSLSPCTWSHEGNKATGDVRLCQSPTCSVNSWRACSASSHSASSSRCRARATSRSRTSNAWHQWQPTARRHLQRRVVHKRGSGSQGAAAVRESNGGREKSQSQGILVGGVCHGRGEAATQAGNLSVLESQRK